MNVDAALRRCALGTIPCLGAFLLWAMWPLHDALRTAGANGTILAAKAGAVLDGANTTLANINRPCKGPAGPDACGTLAQINKTSIAAGDIVNQSRIQVAQSGQLINAAALTIQQVGQHLDSAADAFAGTATAASGALDQARTDLATANGTIAAAQPLVEASTVAVTKAGDTEARIDGFLDSPLLKDDGVQVHGILAHGNAITGDAQTIADKYTHPPPAHWYQRVWNVMKTGAELTWDFLR